MVPKLVEVSSNLGVYYSDVLDHSHFIAEKVAIILTWTLTLQQHAASLQAARVNGVLLLLSVIGTIFAPVQFLSSVYGMNFKHNFRTYIAFTHKPRCQLNCCNCPK
jgi:magnesium transporter